jgi:UDP-N-acetylmuramyl pentapeptide synthase
MEIETVRGIEIVNDAYNASPDAVLELLRSVPEREGRRTIFVLGDMQELGSRSVELHREVGKRFVLEGHTFLITLGEDSEDISGAARQEGLKDVHHFREIEETADFLALELKKGDRIVLKASRALGLERLVPLLKERIA